MTPTGNHKNVVLVPADATPDTEKNYISVNSSLIAYSRKWNKQFAQMNREGNELVASANELNAQTANFNNSLYSMYADLQGIINYIHQHPNWGN